MVSFICELCSDKQTDKQSDKQSDGAERPTHADRQSLINKILQVQSDLKA